MLKGCPNCHTLDTHDNDGLGLLLSGDWPRQNPLCAGCSAGEGYVPSHTLAIAVTTTAGEASFAAQGPATDGSAHQPIVNASARSLAPAATAPG